MTVDYEVTADDMLAFRSFMAYDFPRTQKMNAKNQRNIFIAAGILFALALLGFRNKFMLNFFGPISVCLLIIAIFYPYIVGFIKTANDKKIMEMGFFGKVAEHYHMEINSARIIIRSFGKEEIFSWNYIDAIHGTENHIFIFTTPTTSHIIPKRAFLNQSDFNEFINLIQSCYLNQPINKMSQ